MLRAWFLLRVFFSVVVILSLFDWVPSGCISGDRDPAGSEVLGEVSAVPHILVSTVGAAAEGVRAEVPLPPPSVAPLFRGLLEVEAPPPRGVPRAPSVRPWAHRVLAVGRLAHALGALLRPPHGSPRTGAVSSGLLLPRRARPR